MIISNRHEDATMIFRLAELFLGTGGLAQGETPRRAIGFVAMDAGATRDIKKSDLAVMIEVE